VTVDQFRRGVQETEGLALMRVCLTCSVVHVGYKRTARHVMFRLKTLREESWEDIRDICVGDRSGELMIQQSRIVGYWSRVKNWNKSKRAELRDRRAGDYGLGGVEKMAHSETPQEVVTALAEGGAEMACKIGGEDALHQRDDAVEA